MKEHYIDLMEKALSAYSDDHIHQYFEEVKEKGLTEHGFPRLTANIGILASHGRRQDLIPIFQEMMEFCCTQIPKKKAANDFSVREIICCLRELDRSGIVDQETLDHWKQEISAIDPWTCYTVTAKKPEDPVRNWALFSGVSEFFRQQYGLCSAEEFIDLQIASQLKWFDGNGMYMDNGGCIIHQPMVYDLVARGLFCLLLHFGYRGKYYTTIDKHLKKAGLLSLQMQSVTGELPYGGRSNQFPHNEAWLASLMEFEANRYTKEGNPALSAAFKAGADRALASVEEWLNKTPIRHIKNRFPTETKYGCEEYAYFDKYMITTASFLYTGYLMCDESLPAVEMPAGTPAVCQTSAYFHKYFLKCGDYCAEVDTDGDPHYDSSGLGRLHRRGAPSVIALSVPCPVNPNYTLNLPSRIAISICPGIRVGGVWHFAAEEGIRWECTALKAMDDCAVATFSCRFGEETVDVRYRLDNGGLTVEVTGEKEVACLLPAFFFDGEKYSEISAEDRSLSVLYEGWECRYTTDGLIQNLDRMGGNRNGHYKAFVASAKGTVKVQAEICHV